MSARKPYYTTKVGKVIEETFDARMQRAVFEYLLDKETKTLSKVTEDQIATVKGNAMMTDEFVQCLVRCAVEISKQCTVEEIIEYIKKYV